MKPPTQTPGRIIRRVRRAAGLTREALAQRIGRHHNTVARYERDELDPGAAGLLAVVRECGGALVLWEPDSST